MSKKNFASVNETRAAKGEKLFKNARNLVSGMLHIDLESVPESEQQPSATNTNASETHAAPSESTEGHSAEHHVAADSVEEGGEEKAEGQEETELEPQSMDAIERGSLDFMAYTLVLPPGMHVQIYLH